MNTPLQSDPLKLLAAQWAQRLADSRGEVAYWAHGLSLLGAASAPGVLPSPGLARDDERPIRIPEGGVGIWAPKVCSGETSFVRSAECVDEWGLWGRTHTIPPKRQAKRVVLIGESVARGFLFDPLYTPARSLALMLGGCQVPSGVEVIDLARTSLTAGDLVRLVQSSVHLQPDALVILAGNNWIEEARPRSILDFQTDAAVLRAQGVAGLRHVFEERLRLRTQETLVAVDIFCRDHRVPAVLLIPEFNLDDWRPEEVRIAPHMRDPAKWLETLEQAGKALAANRPDAAFLCAQRALALDQGLAPGGQWLLAECFRQYGIRSDERRRCLEAVRDAGLWDVSAQSPRPHAVIHAVMRAFTPQGAIRIVDLPHIFECYLNGRIPDRQLFLDYCHFSSEGIRVAMAAAAEAVAPLLGGTPESVAATLTRDPGPSAAIEAEAACAAAIHNAHWGQSDELIGHYCDRAIRLSPAMAEVFASFMDMVSREAPLWMCQSTERLGSLCGEALTRYLLLYVTASSAHKLNDQRLFDAMSAALHKEGKPVPPDVLPLRQQELGVGPERRDLNLLAAGQAPSWSYPDWHLLHHWKNPRKPHVYQAHTPVSRFEFLSAVVSGPLQLTFVARVTGSSAGPCRVTVNGASVGEARLDSEWKKQVLRLPLESLKPGCQVLEIHWPLLAGIDAAALEQAACDLESGFMPSLMAVYGHIQTLSVAV